MADSKLSLFESITLKLLFVKKTRNYSTLQTVESAHCSYDWLKKV